ncbi:hypothetical protein HETIRDRAFT_108181 [Heterobasidion irregulare TC 32-1]|uniref:Uncharacterized protein n=1 Tax=Heterobasidion irregulare (strain TC 32-1) TaxID=747525 RepID=W4JQ50_HETIT|nr:uncharacterized protein HETIRDRAFT_108181 [Heterobasidion irregulare TC 32-1]ETW75210.1 hypothetical protein HETIRDRAFT_108181 [Heterobasidion irregulare TC 32-1]
MRDVAEARAPLSTNAYGDLTARRQARPGQTRKLNPVRDGAQTRRHRAARSQVDSPRYERGAATERARWMLEAESGAFTGARRLRALAGWSAESQLEPVLRPSNFKLQDLRLTFSAATPNTRVRTIDLISHVSTILRRAHLQAATGSLRFDRARGACKKHDGSTDGTVSRTSRAASFISTAKLRRTYLSPTRFEDGDDGEGRGGSTRDVHTRNRIPAMRDYPVGAHASDPAKRKPSPGPSSRLLQTRAPPAESHPLPQSS